MVLNHGEAGARGGLGRLGCHVLQALPATPQDVAPRLGVFTEAPMLPGSLGPWAQLTESQPTKLPTTSAKNTPDIIIPLTSTT